MGQWGNANNILKDIRNKIKKAKSKKSSESPLQSIDPKKQERANNDIEAFKTIQEMDNNKNQKA